MFQFSSSIPKPFERIIGKMLFTFTKNIIIEEQRDFFQVKSSFTGLLVFTEYVNTAIEHRIAIDCMYTDFAKVFDSFSVDLLLWKLTCIKNFNSLLS